MKTPFDNFSTPYQYRKTSDVMVFWLQSEDDKIVLRKFKEVLRYLHATLIIILPGGKFVTSEMVEFSQRASPVPGSRPLHLSCPVRLLGRGEAA